MTEREYLVALSLCPNLDPSTLWKLVSKFGTAKDVWQSDSALWLTACRMQPTTVHRLRHWIREFDAGKSFATLSREGIFCLVRGDDDYPKALEELAQPPLVLYAKGTLGTYTRSVSVVGTRKPSGYGLEATKWIAETLAKHGYHIVSGLAEGVDGAAHAAAVRVGGVTTAILGCGVNVCYPVHHERLYNDILNGGGLVVSEYPPNSPVARHHFPQRNRLIAALSPAIIIVQAGEKSGALHTVDAALDLGREVYVVPGPITTQMYRGSNQLLQQGATVLLDPFDFLKNEMDSVSIQPTKIPERWREIYELMTDAKTPAAVARELAKPISHIYAGMLELEVAGAIERRPGGMYVRKS